MLSAPQRFLSKENPFTHFLIFLTLHSHSYLIIRSKIRFIIRVMIPIRPNYSLASIISAQFMSRSFSCRVRLGLSVGG